jgi:hypothetical protein
MSDAAHIARATALMGGNGAILLYTLNRYINLEPERKELAALVVPILMGVALYGIWRGYVALARRSAGQHALADNDEFWSLLSFAVPIALTASGIFLVGLARLAERVSP